MAAIVNCPECNAKGKAVNSLWGKPFRCRNCNKEFLVSREVLQSFAHSPKDPPTGYFECENCSQTICIINGGCPICSHEYVGTKGAEAGNIAESIRNVQTKSKAVLASLIVVLFALALAMSIALVVRYERNRRDADRRNVVMRIEKELAEATVAADNLQFADALKLLNNDETVVASAFFLDPATSESLMTRISAAITQIEARQASHDAATRKQEQEKLTATVENRLETASRAISLYEFEKLPEQFNELLDAIENSQFCDRELRTSLGRKIAVVREEYARRKEDFEEKVRDGWSLMDGNLVSAEERERLEKDRHLAELEKKRLLKEEAEKIRRQREADEAAEKKLIAIEKAEGLKEEAFQMSKQFIRDLLKAPSSARFPKWGEPEVIVSYDRDKNRFSVLAWVDGQNAFGVFIRNRYFCVLEVVGVGRWRSTEARLMD